MRSQLFLDFLAFLKGFEKVNDYIEQFKKDLDNPYYIHRIPMRIKNVEFALQSDIEIVKKLLRIQWLSSQTPSVFDFD